MFILRNWLVSVVAALSMVLNPVPSPTPVPTNLIHQSDIKIVEKEGYSVIGLENDKLGHFDVLIGIKTGSADGYDKRAFFFYDGSYLGADSSGSHPQISLAWRDDKTIALNYVLYNKNDPMCCPTGGSKVVRFRWDGTKLTILDTVPAPEISESVSVPGLLVPSAVINIPKQNSEANCAKKAETFKNAAISMGYGPNEASGFAEMIKAGGCPTPKPATLEGLGRNLNQLEDELQQRKDMEIVCGDRGVSPYGNYCK